MIENKIFQPGAGRHQIEWTELEKYKKGNIIGRTKILETSCPFSCKKST
jgi:hypothetical protein